MASSADEAVLRLTGDEAIVLFELLTRSAEADALFGDDSERAVVHWILCDLEKQMVAPLREDYRHVLEGARKRIAERWGGDGH